MIGRRLISLAVALVATIAGQLIIWRAGDTALELQAQYFVAADPVPILLALVGALLLGAAAFSLFWSSLGAIVVGALHIALSLLLVAWPVDLATGFLPPLQALLLDAEAIVGRSTVFIHTGTGVGMLLGVVLLTLGLLRRRAATGSAVMRIVSAVAGLITVVLIFATLAAGGEVYRQAFQYLQPAVVPILLMVLAALAVAATLVPFRWSTLGGFVSGGIVTLVGVVLLVSPPMDLFRVIAPPLTVTFLPLGVTGGVLAVGLTLIGASLGALLRARRDLRAALGDEGAPVSRDPLTAS